MAKISFSKLKCKVDDSVSYMNLEDGVVIEIKNYLPIQEKLALIGRVIEMAHEPTSNYSNPVKTDVYRDIEVVKAYTNISFTEKQLEDTPKLYDTLVSSGLLGNVIQMIPKTEYATIVRGVKDSILAVYAYRNSVLGVLDTISTDYSNLDLSLKDIQNAIANDDSINFVRNMLSEAN